MAPPTCPDLGSRVPTPTELESTVDPNWLCRTSFMCSEGHVSNVYMWATGVTWSGFLTISMQQDKMCSERVWYISPKFCLTNRSGICLVLFDYFYKKLFFYRFGLVINIEIIEPICYFGYFGL